MITKGEIKQLIRWTGLWVFSFFVAINLRDIIKQYLPDTQFAQIVFGIIGLLVWAYIFNLKKYDG